MHRSPTGAQGAIEHSGITEAYHMLEGAGVLVTGATIDGGVEVPATHPVVRIDPDKVVRQK